MVNLMGDNILSEGIESLVKDPKALEDFSSDLETLMPRLESLAKGGRLVEAQEEALLLEKRARVNYDGATVTKLITFILSMYFNRRDVDGLCEAFRLVLRRRGQLKRPSSEAVNQVITWLGDFPIPERRRVMDAVVAETSGKIFVEAERSRVRRLQAQLLENEGKVEEAAEIMQEEQVEICAGMDKREKTEYILEQMRLVLLKKDFIRLQIISRKINPKMLEADASIHDLKVKYYLYLVEYFIHEDDNFQVAESYKAIYSTPHVTHSKETSDWLAPLEHAVLFALLAPQSTAQQHFLHYLYESKEVRRRLEQHAPAAHSLLKAWLDKYLVNWKQITHGLHKHAVLCEASRWDLLKRRVVQRNLVAVISVYYTRAQLPSLALILSVEVDLLEREIAELAADNKLYAKIDRPAGLVVFARPQSPQTELDAWAENVHNMLDMLESVGHLIDKERMVSAAKQKIETIRT